MAVLAIGRVATDASSDSAVEGFQVVAPSKMAMPPRSNDLLH